MSARAFQVLVLLVIGIASVCAADAELRAVRDNQEVAVSDSARLVAKLVALLESCSVNFTAKAVTSGTWSEVLASPSFVHVAFSDPRPVEVKSSDNQTRERRTIRELLLPLPEGKWPRHVLVRSETDTLSFTKCEPRILRQIALEQDLRLLKTEPYSSLLRALPVTEQEAKELAWQAAGCRNAAACEIRGGLKDG